MFEDPFAVMEDVEYLDFLEEGGGGGEAAAEGGGGASPAAALGSGGWDEGVVKELVASLREGLCETAPLPAMFELLRALRDESPVVVGELPLRQSASPLAPEELAYVVSRKLAKPPAGGGSGGGDGAAGGKGDDSSGCGGGCRATTSA